MSIFRKEKDKSPEPVRETAHAPLEEEFEDYTDISAAGFDSSRDSLNDAAAEDGAMEEIYSTRDKRVKYKRLTPIEAEAAAKRKEATKEDLIRGKLEFSSDNDAPVPDVELKAQLDPDTIVAQDIIEDVREVRSLRNVYVQDIDDIDISLDPMENLREYEMRVNDKERYEARRVEKQENPYVPSAEKIVAYVPVYQHDSKVEKIFLKAGRFTDVVESEYDEYLKSTDPTISKNYHSLQKENKPRQSLLFALSQMAQKHKQEAEEQKAQKELKEQAQRENFDEKPEPAVKKKPSGFAKFFRVVGSLIAHGFSSRVATEGKTAADYNSREDEKFVLTQTRAEIKKLSLRAAAFGTICVAMLVFIILKGSIDALLNCAINFVLTAAAGIIGRSCIVNGVLPLARFRGNSDTAVSLAYLGCLLQSIVSLFTASSFVDGSHHLYSFVAVFGLSLNTIGRLLMAFRVKGNFRFITSHSPAYAAKIYNDEETARRMVSGTTASKGVVAYQHITRFLSDFLKISYAPDPSEDICGKLTPVTIISSLFVTVVYSFVFGSVQGSVSALAVMLCIGIPFTALLAGNIPMLIFSRKMLREGAMVAGYPSVRQFCDSTAVAVPANELFPKGCVKLEEITPYQQFRLNDNLLMAAAILREAGSPVAPVFDELVTENMNELPAVESVIYEEKSGLVGWIGGERVLIGNKALMRRYHITIPDASTDTAKGRQITYIAVAGQAAAKLTLRYLPSNIAAEQFVRAERSGLSFIVSTPDPNVTAELIADLYGLFYRSVKILPTGYANTMDEATSKVEETSRAYLATRGRVSSLARAVGGCIGLKSNISLGIVIEVFGLILGVLLCATLALYASVARLSIVELMIYILFWTAATIVSELVRRP